MNEPWVLVLVVLPFLALLARTVVEITKRSDLSKPRRIGWITLAVVVPVVGVTVYVVVRPPKGPGAGHEHVAAGRAEAIVLLAEQRQRGEIGDEAFRSEVSSIASID